MLDINLIRKNREQVEQKLRYKDPTISLDLVYELDIRRRELQTKVQNLKAERNESSLKIGEYKRNKQDASELLKQVAGFAEEIHQLDRELAKVDTEFNNELSKLPNIPMDDIKVSQDPKENVVIKEFKEKPGLQFSL